MTRKPSQDMTKILAIHNEWLETNGYTLHVKKKNKTSQYKAQATRHNPHAKITKKNTGEGTSYLTRETCNKF